ncbi:hypothetical protein [Mycolicibacterium litorale]|nr:hypothetical protein [Mycolicibacterium litorale]MCV7416496.1 hypothetical protein [Mycolicibacterium litorale]
MRVEPHRRTTDIADGLAGEVADPLWLLLRQWQFGEMTGDDSGSPVAIDIGASWSRFTRYRAEGGLSTEQVPPAEPVPYDPDGPPLEAVVEREPVIRLDRSDSTPWTVAVRAGALLAEMLRAAGRDTAAAALAAHPSTMFAPPDAEAVANNSRVEASTEARYRALLGPADGVGRTIDGAKVLGLHRSGALPAELGLDDLDDLFTAWATVIDEEWGIADATPGSAAWIPDRLEYSYSLAAPPLPGTTDEVVLGAAQYDGRGMHWSSVDHVPGATLGAANDADARVGARATTVLPSPLTFPGMAAGRFWEMEDASVALGTASHGRTDLARMLATEFAVIYSPDWYLAPVEVPVASVSCIDWVIVRDTFGVATLVGTRSTQAGDGVGRQFQPDAADDGAAADTPLLVVLPSALATVTSPALEEVSLQRDEMANLAWSIEQTVMGPAGRAVPRPWFASSFIPPRAISAEEFELVWRLATPVAETWTPLVAVVEGGGDGPRLLRRASILDTACGRTTATKSAVLAEMPDIREEEVSSAGIRLRLVDQLARSHDGRSFVWRGKEKRVWRGEASSALRFDATTPDSES